MVQTRLLRADGDLRWMLTALSLLALLATFALPVLGPGLAAYAPEHGHLTLSGYVPADHVHPWDAEAGTAGASSADSETGDLVFTLATGGDAASGWASATLVPEPFAITHVSLVVVSEADTVSPPAASTTAAPSPPPRV